jgi:hypothetical protein
VWDLGLVSEGERGVKAVWIESRELDGGTVYTGQSLLFITLRAE